MVDNLKIVSNNLLADYESEITFNPLDTLTPKSKEELPFNYYQFYTSISSVYSSKIEGEEIEMDSFFKHKFLKVQYQPDYTKRSDDLFSAYEFVEENELTAENVLASSQRGQIRTNPMFVLNEQDRIEYVACEPYKVNQEWTLLFADIETLKASNLEVIEVFYYAAFIHLIFLKIHPLQDGNGRTARLLEKWFLRIKLGSIATAIELEKNYYLHKSDYYTNIRQIGLEYDTLGMRNK